MNGCEPVCRCCGRDMTLDFDAMLEQVRAHQRYRTLGGPPRRPDLSWANQRIEPPESAVQAPWETR